ncbi:hypothetical protein BDZ89DRAFT_1118014 [Hymenopellis radicata]|nr:hypothetical protein BDZ89DRAFT_1118014 [Hymenopellis radicata]
MYDPETQSSSQPPPLPKGWEAKMTENGRHKFHSNAKLLKQGPPYKESTPKDKPPTFHDACASDTTTVGLDSDEVNLGYPSRATSEASPAMTADAEGHDDAEDLTLDDSEQNAALELKLKQFQDANQKDMIKRLTNKTETLQIENMELRVTVLELQKAQDQAAEKQQLLDAADFLIWTFRSRNYVVLCPCPPLRQTPRAQFSQPLRKFWGIWRNFRINSKNRYRAHHCWLEVGTRLRPSFVQF